MSEAEPTYCGCGYSTCPGILLSGEPCPGFGRPFANHVVKAQDPAKQAAAIERDRQGAEFINSMINSVYGTHTPDCDFPCLNEDHHETLHVVFPIGPFPREEQ